MGMRLHRGRTVTAWWVIRDQRDLMKGIIIIYVDDFLLIGEEQTIKQVVATVQAE